MSVQGDNFRNLAETFDNMSETARSAADAAKAAALAGVSPDKRQRLIEGLGEATSEAQRAAAVEKVLARCIRIATEVEGEFGNSQAALNEIALIRALFLQLVLVWQFEALRDHLRIIGAQFD